MKLLALTAVLVSGCAAMGIITPAEQRRRDALAAQQAAEQEEARKQAEHKEQLARLCANPETPERQQWCFQTQQEEIRLDLMRQQTEAMKRAAKAEEADAQNRQAEAKRQRRRGTSCTTNTVGTTTFTNCD